MSKRILVTLALFGIAVAGVLVVAQPALAGVCECEDDCNEEFDFAMFDCDNGPCANGGGGSQACFDCVNEAVETWFDCLAGCGPLCV